VHIYNNIKIRETRNNKIFYKEISHWNIVFFKNYFYFYKIFLITFLFIFCS
jgi:hypothetical protein